MRPPRYALLAWNGRPNIAAVYRQLQALALSLLHHKVRPPGSRGVQTKSSPTTSHTGTMPGHVCTDKVFLRPCNFSQTANMTLRVSPNELLECSSGDSGCRCHLSLGNMTILWIRELENSHVTVPGPSRTGNLVVVAVIPVLWKYGLNKVVCCPLHQRTTARVCGRLDVVEGRPGTGTYKGRNHYRLEPPGPMRPDGRGRAAGRSKRGVPAGWKPDSASARCRRERQRTCL